MQLINNRLHQSNQVFLQTVSSSSFFPPDLSISFIDTLIDLKNSSSISRIFVFFNSLKSISNSKMLYFTLSIVFFVCCLSFSTHVVHLLYIFLCLKWFIPVYCPKKYFILWKNCYNFQKKCQKKHIFKII